MADAPTATARATSAPSSAATGTTGGTTPDDAPLAEPGERGTLTVADRVVTTIARAAALEVTGVAPAGVSTGGVAGALGRDLPRASAQVAGERVRLEIEVASLWPHPAATVAAAVRDAVARKVHELGGLEADVVDVVIARVTRPTTPRGARVR